MDNSEYMKMAIEEAYEGIGKKHGGPFGCVIVKDGKVIGKGHNRVLAKEDCTCHGEMEAIRDACANIKSHDLAGSVLYTTAAPCPMCKGAILWANIEKVYYGCNVDDADDIGFRDEVFYERWGDASTADFGEELCRKDCLELFSNYVGKSHELY